MTDHRDHRAVRRTQLADHARAAGLDGVLVHSWHRQTVGWLTGYSPGYVTNSATLWLGANGEARLGVRFPFDTERAAKVSGLAVAAVGAATDLVPSGVRRIGLVAGDVAVDEASRPLLDGLARADVAYVDLRDVVDDLQEAKLPGEIDALRHAGEVAAAALSSWGDGAPAGVTDYAVAARIEAAARAAGARRAICLVGIGPGAVVTECQGREIGPRDEVGLEFTLYVDEWCMHVNTQLRAAEPTADNDRAQQVCAEARAAMLRAMRPEVTVDEVVAVGDAVLASAGLLSAKEYDFGHGLAGDTPAHPRLVTGTGRALREHAVAALHVAVRAPGGATGIVGGPVVVDRDGAAELNPDAVWARRTAAASMA